MTKKYEPSNGEIYKEMWSELRNVFSRENISTAGRSLKGFGGLACGTGGAMLLLPYIVPTALRCLREADGDLSGYSSAEKVGGWVGTLGGLAADIGQISGYVYLATHDHPEVLAIPAATNFLSGVYELGRAAYGNARDRVIERHATDYLESSESRQPNLKL